MKKYYHLFMLAATGLLFSCSELEKDLNEQASEDTRALELSVQMSNKQTKTLLSGNSMPEGSEIGIALYGSDGQIYDRLPYSNVKFSASGSGSTQNWTPELDVMLSANKAKLYAYYPYSSDIKDITSIEVEASSSVQTDYLYAGESKELYNHDARATITMKHALAAVRLSIKKGTYSGTGIVSALSIKGDGIGTKGIMNAKNGSIRSISGIGSEIAADFDPITLTSASQDIDIIAIPVESSKSIEISVLIDGEKFTINTEAVQLEAGKIAIYDATVNNSEISLSSVSIGEWGYNSAGTPVIQHKYCISLGGDIEDISFSNSIEDDGSVKIIAVPMKLDAEVNPVTIEGETSYSESVDIDRGIRTIILSDIKSDINITFNSYSLWTTATYNISNISAATTVINTHPINNSMCLRMIVDGEEVTPSATYQFTETGEHIIKFSFIPFTNSGTVLDRFQIPELGFQNVTGLVGIRVPEGYTRLRNQIFNGCKNLREVSLPQSLTNIGYNIFYNCSSLERLIFPDNISSFPSNICYRCTALSSVTLPKNLKSLGSSAFNSCSALTEIELPDGVTTIGSSAFQSSGITKLEIPDGVSVIPDQMCMSCNKLEEIKLPASLSQIGRQAIYSCPSLSKIILADGTECMGTLIIPEGVSSIGSLAFYGPSFTAVQLPSSLSNISPGALANDSVETLSFNAANSTYDIRGNAVVETASNTLVAACKNSLIDESVSSIGERAYYECDINTIDIHAGVTSIGNEAFCSASPSVIISRATTPPTLGTKSFWIGKNNGTLKVPESAIDAYKEQWMIDETGYLGNSVISWQIKAL